VRLSEWDSNAIVRFDPLSEKFKCFPSTRTNAAVRQILGRQGEVWCAESGHDRLLRLSSQF
jgi:virginiamycin B lyase